MMSRELPLVSIICPTYNHEKYISQAIEGFLMQKTSFPFEIIMHDDASTDKTADIIRQYESKYPSYFRNIYQKENQFSKSGDNIIKLTFAAARGKYIAVCEGDDYWTDSEKLQRQADFLENNSNYNISFHRVYELNDSQLILSTWNSEVEEKTFNIDELSRKNFIYTLSVMFRKSVVQHIPEWLSTLPACDYALHLLYTNDGLIKYFPEPMAVYRRHSGGVWGGKSERFQVENWILVLKKLSEEFLAPSQVNLNLRYQLAEYTQKLAKIHLKEEDKKGYYNLLSESLKYSEEYTRDWVISNNQRIDSILYSKEYKWGSRLLYPIKKLVNILEGRNK